MMLSLESLAYKADDAGGEFNAAQREVGFQPRYGLAKVYITHTLFHLSQVQRRVEQIDSDCQRLDVLANKEPVTRRQNAKIRVEQLKQDVRHLQAALRSVAMKHVSRIQEDRNREQLLTMRFTTNAASRSPMQAANGSETSLLIDGALEHRGALDVSRQHLKYVCIFHSTFKLGMQFYRDGLRILSYAIEARCNLSSSSHHHRVALVFQFAPPERQKYLIYFPT